MQWAGGHCCNATTARFNLKQPMLLRPWITYSMLYVDYFKKTSKQQQKLNHLSLKNNGNFQLLS